MKKVGILGATGVIGRHYLELLQNHPRFEFSPDRKNCDFFFSALPNEVAIEQEKQLKNEGYPVISSASPHRLDPHVPVVIPEVNPHHLDILPKKGGFIVTKPNCSIQSFLIPLAPLHRKFGIKAVTVTSLQAISGAGKQGLFSHEIHDNVIPYISGEEEKSEEEPRKILGTPRKNTIVPDTSFNISSHCTRVPVLHGHLSCVSVLFNTKPSREEMLQIWSQPTTLDLPSAPKNPILYLEDPERPQTRLDRDTGKGMSVTVGRLRPCPLFHWRFVALSHNTVRGGAGGGLLIAELLDSRGFLG